MRSDFRSGNQALDLYFHRYAGQNQFRHHIGVTYVAIGSERILGYVSVSAGSLDADHLPSGRKMPPYPLPIFRLARLAVDHQARGMGLGRRLLRYCIELAEKMAREVGCVGLVVDSKPEAIEFYVRLGFHPLDLVEGASAQRPSPTAMFLPLGSVPRQG